MKILIADDDVTTRLMLKGIVAKFGFEVCEAASGREAWEHFLGSEATRLAIIDWIMPGMSGPELCRRVKERAGKQPPYIIMLTSKAERQDVVEGLDAGADDFMVKPCDCEELRARITVGLRIVGLQQAVWDANEQLEERVQRRTVEVEQLLRRMEGMWHHLGHDLKTPLTPLLSMLPILLETEAEPERQEMLALALDGARDIRALVGRVLELCQAGSSTPVLRPQGEDLSGLVNAAIGQCRIAHSPGSLVLRNEVPAGCCVRADPLQVRRVLASLLDNAVRFTAPGGVITLRAGRLDGWISVAVADDGIGLEESQLARIFEPFFKAEPSRHDRGAIGLSLSIVKTLVERQGGRIWAESPGAGRGTTFWFTLPEINPTQ